MPGVSRNTICVVSLVRTPRTCVRVVCGRSETIETFCPTSWFNSVDLPTFGRPTIETNPDRNVTARGGGSRALLLCGRALGRWGRSAVRDPHQHDAPALDAFRAELEPVDPCALALDRHVPERVEHQAAHRVPLLLGQLGVEQLVHLVDRGAAGHAERATGKPLDLGLVDVVLVGDLADDLLEQVFHRDETRRAAVLVDHDRHVELLGLHLA